MRIRSSFLAGALALATACSHDGAAPLEPAVDHDAEGSWGPDDGGVLTPGFTWIIALQESSGTITGTGSFAGEAGPYGGMVVSGTVANDSVHLRIVYVFEPTVFPLLAPDTAQFDGLLVSRNRIDGRLVRRGSSEAFPLVRAVAFDPY